jgi:lantibiotic transport system ATP-binding protein
MIKYCLETKGLTHLFSENQLVLDDINLQVQEGSIYGFLGPNGAGKTTALRLILGLLKKQKGEISFFEKSFLANRVDTLRKVGSLIESPSLYGHLTAFENLILLKKIYQCPKERIGEVLRLVGLAETGKKKVTRFSLGMKQRLSIAIALLHDPSLLILDEPTNGLDPNGIIEMRELLKKLNQERGTTIVISSHLLAEIEKLVTHVGIIHKGKMMFQGTLDALKDKQQQSSHIVIETSNNEEAMRIIRYNNIVPERDKERIVMPVIARERIASINSQFVGASIAVYEISTIKNDLESIFMDVINN